jgi:hypothetical protein
MSLRIPSHPNESQRPAPQATRDIDLRQRAKHRIKIAMQAIEIQRMRELPRQRQIAIGCEAFRLELLLARHQRRMMKGSEMPTPQAFPAPRDLSTERFVMARLAESA